MSGKTPAGRLVGAFGDADAMAALLAPDVRWYLPVSTPFPHPIEGREAVRETMTKIFGEVYGPGPRMEFLDELGDEASSAVRFTLSAEALWVNRTYVNEYTLFARCGPQGIFEVNEAFDTKRTLDFFREEEKVEFKGFSYDERKSEFFGESDDT